MCLCVAAIQIAFHPGIFECFVSSFGGGGGGDVGRFLLEGVDEVLGSVLEEVGES